MSSPDVDADGNRSALGLEGLGPILGGYDEEELFETPSATHWPAIPAADAEAKWDELCEWVGQLQERFSHIDHHVIPRCWWRHNEHVEALLALWDHERASFGPMAPATAPVDWFRALRDISALLRAWTSEFSCSSMHQEEPVSHLSVPTGEEWEGFVRDDVERRLRRESEHRPA
ncbi:MAG: hypothetical protein ACYDGN_14160 [Acidimicrobiales bacterium]